MGGGAFLLLKTGDFGPESSKQAEIRLAILLKILQIARFSAELPKAVKAHSKVVFSEISVGYG
jgi:hypothetical protein